MNVKQIFKNVWKRSKLSYLILAYSATMVYLFSLLRLGNHILLPVRKWLEKSAREEYKPSKAEFGELEWFASYAINVFQFHDKVLLQAAYPTFDDHVVDEYREARYTIIREGSKVYVSIRGSNNEQNWEDGLTSHQKYDGELSTAVHSGYMTVAKGIADILSQYCNDDDEIYVTGGSMGGATSILVGWYLADRGYGVKKIWAFANPKVTSGDYGHLPVVSVLDLRDPVVHLPSFHILNRYRHQGKRLVLSEGTWYMYEDSWKTDLLTSIMFATSKIDVQSHMGYADRLLELKSKLGYNGIRV